MDKKHFNLFCRKIFNTHPQGRGIFKFKFWQQKYKEDLIEAFEYHIN